MNEAGESMMYRIGRSKKIQAAILFGLIGGFIFLYSGLKITHQMDAPIFKWENAAFQIRSAFMKPPEEIKKIAIVEVDDETLWKIHQPWSFPRSIHADFLKKLAAYDPKLIAFHFMFAGKTTPEEDKALADAVKEVGDVILASRITINGEHLISEPEMQQAALASGVVSKPRETDNSLRRSYTYFSTADKPMAGLSSELVTLLQEEGKKPEDLKIENKELLIPSLSGEVARLPLMDYGVADINFKVDPKYFTRIPYWQIYTGQVDPNLLKDKIVLVGITSRILLDVYDSPLGLQPGVVINAHNLLMLMTRDFLHRVPEGMQLALLLVIGAMMGFIGFRYSFFKAMGGAILILSAFVAASAFLFMNDWIWDFFGPMLVLVAAFVISNATRSAMMFLENVSVKHEAVTDPLTKLFTRRFLEAKADQEIKRLKSGKGNLSVLMTDVDHFKSVNDVFGHDEGDRVLVQVASALKKAAAKDEIVTRFGGEEFCVILPDAKKDQAFKIGEKFREAVAKSVAIERDGKVVRNITISVGVSSAREDNFMEFQPLMKGADLALYHSKEDGRNRVTAFKESFANGEKAAKNGEGQDKKAA